MSHPAPHPGTPTPPPGPSRRDAAAIAGSYGRSASPLDDLSRIGRYWAQNGQSKGLTPRQRRRAEHKACRAFYRYDETSVGRPGVGAAGIDVTAAPAHPAA